MKNWMKKILDSAPVQFVARAVVKVGEMKSKIAVAVGGFGFASLASAQTDATVIATQAQTAFGIIAPITITIAAFYVILKIAKRVVH